MRVPTEQEMAIRQLFESRDKLMRSIESKCGLMPTPADMVALRSISKMTVMLADMSRRVASLTVDELAAAHAEMTLDSHRVVGSMMAEALGFEVGP